MNETGAASCNAESSNKKQDISDEKNLVVSFIQFLRQRISREQCTADQVEGIEGCCCYILLQLVFSDTESKQWFCCRTTVCFDHAKVLTHRIQKHCIQISIL